MINEAQEWGDFSEWLSRINDCIERERTGLPQIPGNVENPESVLNNLAQALHRWVRQIAEAPITTWKEELSVRGFDFEYSGQESALEISQKLEQLMHDLANMRVFFINTDHLSDRELYRYLVEDMLTRPIAQIPFEQDAGCVIDIVGLEVQEDPINWLQYYASNRERMEWAKQNPGKGLPMALQTPFMRDRELPQP